MKLLSIIIFGILFINSFELIDEDFVFIDCNDERYNRQWFLENYPYYNNSINSHITPIEDPKTNLKLHFKENLLIAAEDISCINTYFQKEQQAHNLAGELMNYIWSLAERRVKNMLLNLFYESFVFENCENKTVNREDFVDYFLLRADEPVEVRINNAEIRGSNMFFFSPVRLREDYAIFYWAQLDERVKRFRIYRAKQFYCNN